MYKAIREKCKKDPSQEDKEPEAEPEEIEIVPDLETEMFYMGDELGCSSFYGHDKEKSIKGVISHRENQQSSKPKTNNEQQNDKTNVCSKEKEQQNPKRKRKVKWTLPVVNRNNTLIDLYGIYCVRSVWKIKNTADTSQ